LIIASSWPGLTRSSTSSLYGSQSKTWITGSSPVMTKTPDVLNNEKKNE